MLIYFDGAEIKDTTTTTTAELAVMLKHARQLITTLFYTRSFSRKIEAVTNASAEKQLQHAHLMCLLFFRRSCHLRMRKTCYDIKI